MTRWTSWIELGGPAVDVRGHRGHPAPGTRRCADFYASLRTQAAIEKAEVGVVLVDASDSLSEQDIRVVQQVIDAGRALVIAYNKWDLMDDERRATLEKEIAKDLGAGPVGPTGERLRQDALARGSAREGTDTALEPGTPGSPPGG